MRWERWAQFLAVVALCGCVTAWAQGRRGAAQAAAALSGAPPAGAPPGVPAQAAPVPLPAPAARGGRAGGGASADPFFNYETAQANGAPLPETPIPAHLKITVNGAELAYTAHVGFMPVRNATSGQTLAQIFYTYYSKDGVSDSTSRPLLFALGGGPGVAASWQELGGLGPKRIQFKADGSVGLPPYRWGDNPETLLSQADLVFVNPVGTAYSRPATPALGASFANDSTGIASLGEFVRSFLNQYDRWNSPRILVGEDSGTARASALASYLTEHDIPVNGVALLSITPTADAIAGDEEFMTLLPSETLAAWYHKKLGAPLAGDSADQAAAAARQFASREYLHALYQGDRMTAAERTQAAADMARLTGLAPNYVQENDLRLPLARFDAALLQADHENLSPSDARATTFAAPAGGRGGFGRGGGAPIDIHQTELGGGFLTAYELYLKNELGFNDTGVYYLAGGGIAPAAPTAGDEANLAALLERNPKAQVFVALDYFDLNAPFYAGEFTLAHLGISPAAREHNLTVEHFASGAMPYTDAATLPRLHADLATFIAAAGGGQ